MCNTYWVVGKKAGTLGTVTPPCDAYPATLKGYLAAYPNQQLEIKMYIYIYLSYN